MARQLKPAAAGEYIHRAYGSVPLFLNRNDFTFFAEVAGSRITAASNDELHKLVGEAVAKLIDLDWAPIILISRDGGYNYGGYRNNVSFRFERFYVAKAADGTYRKSEWTSPFRGEALDRTKHCSTWTGWQTKYGDFNPPCNPIDYHGKPELSVVYLPYDDATWAALETLDAMLITLKSRLADLLFVPENAALLTERLSGVKLLGM